tara:strand:+ start:87 stop:512 length:426 start_codon:yes stop_codon:yes gene_type:complete
MKNLTSFVVCAAILFSAPALLAQQDGRGPAHQHGQFDRMDRKIEDARQARGDKRHEMMREHMQMMRDQMQAMHGTMGGAGSGQMGQGRMGPGQMGQGGMGGGMGRSGPETMQNMQTRLDMMQRMMEQMQKQHELMLDDDKN